jgi:flavin reductase (DIM6/NTAB) family NADH-FMN oxidoreductase RutF
MSDLLDSYMYSWPHSELNGDPLWRESGSLFSERLLPESLSELEKDSRWPLFFPATICIVTTADGKTVAMEKVVGPSIVNRFPYIMALSFCVKPLSKRHHVRSLFTETLEKGGGVAVQFFPPGKLLDQAMAGVINVEEKLSGERVAHTGMSTRKALTNDSPVFDNAYLIYEAQVVRPRKDFHGRKILEKPWVDYGSHRVYFLEINALQLDEKIACGEKQIAWRSLPVWSPEIERKVSINSNSDAESSEKYIKGYTPHYRFPSSGTVAFESDGCENSMAIKRLSPLPEDQVEVDNDRARWPCFFPSSVGMITAYSENRTPNLMPCGSTTIISRHPLIVGIALSNTSINERYAPRASLEMISKTGKFGCGVPFVDEKILNAIRYTGNISFKSDPQKIYNSGLEFIETSSNTPVLSDLPLHMDCEVIDQIHLGTHTLFLGEIKRVLVRKDVTPENPLKWIPWADVEKGEQ